jgi:BlaI family penicillinase repressor
MVRTRTPIPTPAETRALLFLLERGSATVREYLQEGPDIGDRAYTTIMTLMNVLHTKGLATRTPEGKAYRYQAAIGLEELRRLALEYVLDHFFSGDLSEMQQALASFRRLTKRRKDAVHLGVPTRRKRAGVRRR